MYTDTLTLLKDTSYSAFFLKKNKTKQKKKKNAARTIKKY